MLTRVKLPYIKRLSLIIKNIFLNHEKNVFQSNKTQERSILLYFNSAVPGIEFNKSEIYEKSQHLHIFSHKYVKEKKSSKQKLYKI